jgi:rhamnulokinase
MTTRSHYLAVDLGASAGRVVLGRWDGARFDLEELHRFRNGPVEVLGHLYWDVLYLWQEIKIGLATFREHWGASLAGLGVDTWGVDFALLDRAGRLMGTPYHYRDPRTNGVPEKLFSRVARHEIFEETGIQFMQFNTLFQLFSMVDSADPMLDGARTLLMMPDLFHYWLTGSVASEYTIASTSQMLPGRERRWATGLLARLGIPTGILPPLVPPGTILDNLRPEILAQSGLGAPVPVIATGSHDTADAVAAIPDLDESSAYISSGTWSLVGVEVEEPVITEEALAWNFTNEGGVDGKIRLLKNVAGLWLLQESRRQWRREGRDLSWDELLQLASGATPFQSLVDPDAGAFLNPGDMPAAIRDFCRATGQPEPVDVGSVVRCCLESLALKYRWVMEALETVIGRRLRVIRIVGGGSRNRLLCQFTADACQRSVVAGPVEATALGNLMVQAIATGRLADVSAGRAAIAASVERERFEPRSRDDWEQAYRRFRDLL